MQKMFVILPNNCILANYVKMKIIHSKMIFRCLMASFLILMTQALASCMKDEETVSSSECAITSFSVGSISSQVTIKKYDSNGNATDTTVTRTITGSEILFNIDQVKGKIFTVNELPNWIDLTKVVPSFVSNGNVFGQVGIDSLYYVLSSGKDSINFTKPVSIVCVGYDGVSSKSYTVEMKKSSKDLYTMEWEESKSLLNMKGLEKVFKDASSTYVFGKDANGKNVYSFFRADIASSGEGEMPNADLDCSSVTEYDGNFYALDSDGCICCANPFEVGKEWKKVSEKKVQRLLGADSMRLYAFDGNAIIGTSDFSEWKEYGNADMDMLPESCLDINSYASKTNKDMAIVVMTGLTSKNAENGVAWYKVTSMDENIDQDWSYIQVTKDNKYGLPLLANLSVARSKGALYAIGAKNGAYECFYKSDDNGITWHALSLSSYPLPEGLSIEGGRAVLLGSDDCLWIMQENGNVWEAMTL